MAYILYNIGPNNNQNHGQNPRNMQRATPPRTHKPHITTRRFPTEKTKKKWKKHLYTYHLIRKAIYLTRNSPNWQAHPIMNELINHTHTNIPPPPTHEPNQQEWTRTIANTAKAANIQARKITSKYTQDCIKKTISKYRQLYDKNPKKINKKVFKNQETPL